MEEVIQRINQYIAQREKLDPTAVFEQMKGEYPLVVTMESDCNDEIPVLCGESSAGKFELWDNGLDIIFDIYKPDGTYTHWHPSDVAEAMEAVREFMEGEQHAV